MSNLIDTAEGKYREVPEGNFERLKVASMNKKRMAVKTCSSRHTATMTLYTLTVIGE